MVPGTLYHVFCSEREKKHLSKSKMMLFGCKVKVIAITFECTLFFMYLLEVCVSTINHHNQPDPLP